MEPYSNQNINEELVCIVLPMNESLMFFRSHCRYMSIDISTNNKTEQMFICSTRTNMIIYGFHFN